MEHVNVKDAPGIRTAAPTGFRVPASQPGSVSGGLMRTVPGFVMVRR